jgi:predicted RNA binding protein YcfA (HicA-like mRNA interferase family)
LKRAQNNPAGMRFQEFCRLCECAGMELDRTKGSHYIYRKDDLRRLFSIQKMPDGKAKAYQVRQVLDFIQEFDLLKE